MIIALTEAKLQFCRAALLWEMSKEEMAKLTRLSTQLEMILDPLQQIPLVSTFPGWRGEFVEHRPSSNFYCDTLVQVSLLMQI